MPQTAILVELDRNLHSRLLALALDRKQPISEVAADIISRYLAPEGWEHPHLRAGLTEFDAGQYVSNERVLELLESWSTQNEPPAPKRTTAGLQLLPQTLKPFPPA